MIGSISCYFGYSTSGGASEVGKAVKSTSVVTLISIIVMDFLVSVSGESLSRLVQEVASL
jgi:ABC-type transporter Mla maintaining outer membrane lipid asymmetry permease subunit MlaE